jgi:hypothetical protein
MNRAAALELEVGDLLVVTPIPRNGEWSAGRGFSCPCKDIHGLSGKDQPLLLRRDTGLLLDFLLGFHDLS